MSHFQDSFWVSLWSCREIQCRAHECTSVEVIKFRLAFQPPLSPSTEGRNKETCSCVFITTRVELQCKIYQCKAFEFDGSVYLEPLPSLISLTCTALTSNKMFD